MGGVVAVAVEATRALYLFAPLLVSAALSGVVLRFNWFPTLRRPIDFGATFRGRRLFGDSKTWRGVIVAIVGCVASVALQQQVLSDVVPASLEAVDYRSTSPFCFGTAMGVGAMAGELPNSFTKRQFGIPPGQSTRGWPALAFYVWDQVDLLTGAWPLVLFWVRPSASVVAASFVVAMLVHPVVAAIGFAMGARTTAR